MLLLQFQAGPDRYGLDIGQVIEVSSWFPEGRAPRRQVAGTFNYRERSPRWWT